MAARYNKINTLAFYDTDKTGKSRAVRNDLSGSFTGMVQFAQSHTVDPQGNEARNMPRLTSEREALLLVTPSPELGELQSLSLVVTVDGQTKSVKALLHPSELYRSDYNNRDGRPDVSYSHRAWSVVLPWDWVKPGLSLSLADDKGRAGVLEAGKIDFAAPGELVVNNIRLGMLTDPPNSGGHWMLLQPARAAADYFQTIPAARFTVASYEDIKLTEVMVSSGVIYTTASVTTGDVYSGDMREDTAKSTFSVGINLANWGVTSASMKSQNQPQLTQAATVHHARGKYANGEFNAGLSGGNSILTLIDSVGNEFSHEIGHHYGLGHYPGQNGDNFFWAGHHHDSGWGYIGYRKRMRANLHWTQGKNDGLKGMPVFADQYAFAPDAMSGGSFSSSLSRYTHYTGYSTKIQIQPSMDKAVITPVSSTGFLKWNAGKRAMEEISPSVPTSNQVWYNAADGKFRKPRLFGVPAFTILGGYDPVNGIGLLYPAARTNWANVFDLPAPLANASVRQCWLSVDYANGKNQLIALAPNRMSGNANKLGVNLAEGEAPKRAGLFCQEPGAAAKELSSIEIPQGLPAMSPAVVVGKEAGYAALRAVELPEFDAALQGLAGKPVPRLSGTGQLLYESYAENPSGLSPAAQQQLARYAEQRSNSQRLNRWMYVYSAKLEAGEVAAQQALLAFIDSLGLTSTPLLPSGQTLKNGSSCLKMEGSALVITGAAQCSGAIEEKWLLDARGAIHSQADPGLCLTDQGERNPVLPMACDVNNEKQEWDHSVAQKISRGTGCFDLSGGQLTNGRGTLITWGCSGGNNQKWAGLVASDNRLLPLLDADNARLLARMPAAVPVR